MSFFTLFCSVCVRVCGTGCSLPQHKAKLTHHESPTAHTVLYKAFQTTSCLGLMISGDKRRNLLSSPIFSSVRRRGDAIKSNMKQSSDIPTWKQLHFAMTNWENLMFIQPIATLWKVLPLLPVISGIYLYKDRNETCTKPNAFDTHSAAATVNVQNVNISINIQFKCFTDNKLRYIHMLAFSVGFRLCW